MFSRHFLGRKIGEKLAIIIKVFERICNLDSKCAIFIKKRTSSLANST